MSRRGLLIYKHQDYDEATKIEIKKINDYIVDLMENKRHYRNVLRFLKVVASKFEELGIKSDIYYKITSVKNCISTSAVDQVIEFSGQRIFDVYLECTRQKDYRNAVKMLDYYKSANPFNQKFADLHMAYSYIKISSFDEARRILKEIHDDCFENPDYYVALAELEYKTKNYDKVVEILPLLEKYDGYTRFDSYILTGKAYYLLGQMDEANKLFEIAKNIIQDDDFYNRISKKFILDANEEKNSIHPTKGELSVQYQIANDRNDYQKAIDCLTALQDKTTDETVIKRNNRKIYKLQYKLNSKN